MLADIFITGLFRTLIEVLPFLAVIVLERKGETFQKVYRNQFGKVGNAEVMPDFTDQNDDDAAAVRQVAGFSVAKHDTNKYAKYSFIVITVIFFSKIPAVISLPARTVQIGLVTFGVITWAIAAYKLYDWHMSAKAFYDEVSPFPYFRDQEDEMYRRTYSLLWVGEVSIQRHQADILLINGTPILVLLLFNAVLISMQVVTTLPTDATSCLLTPG